MSIKSGSQPLLRRKSFSEKLTGCKLIVEKTLTASELDNPALTGKRHDETGTQRLTVFIDKKASSKQRCRHSCNGLEATESDYHALPAGQASQRRAPSLQQLTAFYKGTAAGGGAPAPRRGWSLLGRQASQPAGHFVVSRQRLVYAWWRWLLLITECYVMTNYSNCRRVM